MPSSSELSRVQFWNGVVVKYAAVLPVGDDDVVDAECVAEGELHAGEEVGEARLRGETGDDAHEPGGGEQARARGLRPGEGEEDGGDGEDDDERRGEAAQDGDLRLHAPCDAVVGAGDLCRVVPQHDAVEEEPHDRGDEPCPRGDRHDDEDARVHVEPVLAGQGDGERDPHGDDEEQHPEAPS